MPLMFIPGGPTDDESAMVGAMVCSEESTNYHLKLMMTRFYDVMWRRKAAMS